MGTNIILIYYSIGFLMICHQISCNVHSTPINATKLKENITTNIFDSPRLTSSHDESLRKSPAINLFPTQLVTTRKYEPTTVLNDESLIDVTVSVDTLCADKRYNVAGKDYNIKVINGDITVSIVLSQSTNSAPIITFITNRINEKNLLVHNVSIGVRIVQVLNLQNLVDAVEGEIDYLEQCTENPFGLFLSNEFWFDPLLKGKSYDLAVWPLPAIESIKLKTLAHLLTDLPLPVRYRNARVQIKTDSQLNRTENIQHILKHENMCLKNQSEDNDDIYVFVGYEDFLDSAKLFAANKTLIIVPLLSNHFNISDIPDQANVLVALEPEIEICESINSTQSIKTTPSELIIIASTFMEVCKSINNAIWKSCSKTINTAKLNLTECQIFKDLHVSEIPTNDVKQMLKLFQLTHLENNMNYNMYQKIESMGNKTSHSNELKKLLSLNYSNNITTIYESRYSEMIVFGSFFDCNQLKNVSSQTPTKNHKQPHYHGDNSFNMDETFPPQIDEIEMNEEFVQMYWRIRSELWVFCGLMISTLGILVCIAILTFIIVRLYMEDVLEGNPIGSVVILLALIGHFASFFPFTIEFVGYGDSRYSASPSNEVWNSMCIIKIFVVSVTYCLIFSLLLSRAIMLASIGSEGGFLSHVNGYIQSIICFFSFLVQLGLSTQLLIIMHANQKHLTCEIIYYGNWFWGIIGYPFALLCILVMLAPCIVKSQRNYREGILIVTCSILCLIWWLTWIPLSMINNNFREMMVPLGVQVTGWIILSSVMIPRSILIVKSIARTDFTQALPSLTSLAFAQANQFISDPSIYECVNPTMRTLSNAETEHSNIPNIEYVSPSEVPTLPLRSGRRQFIEHYQLNFNEVVNPELPSPNKMTRF